MGTLPGDKTAPGSDERRTLLRRERLMRAGHLAPVGRFFAERNRSDTSEAGSLPGSQIDITYYGTGAGKGQGAAAIAPSVGRGKGAAVSANPYARRAREPSLPGAGKSAGNPQEDGNSAFDRIADCMSAMVASASFSNRVLT